jgi:hypothetical protein
MPDREWETWDAQEPPPGFAARVVADAHAERRTTRRRRGGRVLAGAVVVTTMAAGLVMAFRLHNVNTRGDVVAADARREVRVGTRAIAVLEKGAHVTWDGDAITQGGGDVFWRVEPGARFTVHTAAADVAVKGTCFRVNVRGDEDVVGVYEGKVAVSRAGQSVDIGAGEGARADASGVRKTEPGASAEADDSRDDGAWLAANQSLADQVKTYRHRLDSVDAQKRKLEKDLAAAEAKLADAGTATAANDHFSHEPSQDELTELAKQGEIRLRLPCKSGSKAGIAADDLQKLGLAPQDGPVVADALGASMKRSWTAVKQLCAQAVGGADVAERVGENACINIVMNNERENANDQYREDIRRVAEIRAGLRPAPAAGDDIDPFERMLLSLTSETKSLENDLAQSLGPDDARRVVYGEAGCWTNQGIGVGPRQE